MPKVELQFLPGFKRRVFRNVRVVGTWDENGRFSARWSELSMQETTGADGCPMFTASVVLDSADRDRTFRWGVVVDCPQGNNLWGIATEVQNAHSTERHREFRIDTQERKQIERYCLTYLRYLGANKYSEPPTAAPSLRFGVWAPNASRVEVVFGKPEAGYIDDAGDGIDAKQPRVPLTREANGLWCGGPAGSFDNFKSLPYMYRIVNAQGKTVYRTDIFSRSQAGRGCIDPARNQWAGTVDTLDGTVSCSVVIDPDVVRSTFEPAAVAGELKLIGAEEFWASEFTPGLPVPTRVEDLVIYELHVGSLGFGKERPGNLGDAMAFLDHVSSLGVNAIELLPMAEFSGSMAWGYGDTHHMCIEASAGGRDQYRHFVRECHRRGIAVIQDVVYNHYDGDALRAEWQYDSETPEQNIYYWYEGLPSDYPRATDGYLYNGSSGWSPRFWEPVVRQQFISSAVFLIEEMHVDGLRLDLTQAIHRDNALEGDHNKTVASANQFGQKLLREWSRTLRMIRPTVFLIAEDHTGWDAVTKSADQGGLGFDATWRAAFYHDLIGDSDMASGSARLLKNAGMGGDGPLAMDRFSSELYASQYNRVVYHESHDEAGNAGGTARTMTVAVNGAPLFGETRKWAEARSRVCFGLSVLSAGTPMFFMGEEVGAQKPYTFGNFMDHREDILGDSVGIGNGMFAFYRDLITLSRKLRSVRGHNIDILNQSDENRVIAFKRWSAGQEIIVVASLNNAAFSSGYVIEKDQTAIPNAGWREIFNSDAAVYGGRNVGNGGAVLGSWGGRLNVVIPAAGFVVLGKV